jgi:hypothetical protein
VEPHRKAALAAAGVEGRVRPFHDSRHTALTHMAAGRIESLRDHGHSRSREHGDARRYLHLAGVTFKDEAAALEQRLFAATEPEGVENSGRK